MNLDDAAAVRNADPGLVIPSIDALPEQCASALEAARGLALPEAFARPAQVVVVGMGGSALAAEIARALLAPALRAPFVLLRGDPLPAWVGPATLVILSSYSGATEEVLAAAEEALARTGRVVAVTTGGPLAERLASRERPVLRLDPAVNPCGQPRFAVGGSLFALLALLERVGAVASGIGDAAGATIGSARASTARYGPAAPRAANAAKDTALFLEGRAAAVVASAHLAGNARALANQLNETAKTFAAPFEIPELNHHLMEGLHLPRSNPKTLSFLFIESARYPSRVRTRFAATREVVARQGIPDSTFTPGAPAGGAPAGPGHGDAVARQDPAPAVGSPLEEVLDTLAFGSYLSAYLALRSGQDPAVIPWVDHFKSRLSALSGR